MGSLPWVTLSRSFQHTGVNFAGPIWLRTSKGRGHKTYKAFVSVFVCFSCRAVHLEDVSDYSADAFLAAFRRFVARRGVCQAIYTTIHTRSSGYLRTTASGGISQPPAAPHFGGLWEAAVKALKHHLRRVIGETKLIFKEMATFLAKIEACVNSRPLQALTDDPEDLDALTPGHFLIGAPLNAIPEPLMLDVPVNQLSRWRLLQQMRDHL
ncbi:hypothetical protein RF55_10667 [Lasius niger]|uniref:Integrase catalytic domain-containing protein n=1 Tax=Lasius niger TaxID=67767 RepID=A0A0J7NAN6_LASNI|nr:hypothetical protein RF55_10667 [Lasius niger]